MLAIVLFYRLVASHHGLAARWTRPPASTSIAQRFTVSKHSNPAYCARCILGIIKVASESGRYEGESKGLWDEVLEYSIWGFQQTLKIFILEIELSELPVSEDRRYCSIKAQHFWRRRILKTTNFKNHYWNSAMGFWNFLLPGHF